jgi:hypothetical protein
VQRRHADVAQLVEQLIRNQQVIGSSPIVGSITIRRLLFPGKIQSSRIPHGPTCAAAVAVCHGRKHPAFSFFLPCTKSKNTQVLRFDIRAPSLVPLIH